jgi:anti-sigma factor RsiW
VTCLHSHESAPYVLGALSPAERAEYQQHLASCSICQAEVSDLAVLPGLLGRLDTAAAEAAGGSASRVDPAGDSARSGARNLTGARVGGSEQRGPSAESLPALLSAAQRQRSRATARRRWQTVAASLVAAALAVVATIGVRGMVASTPSASPSPSTNLVAMRRTGSPWPLSAEIALSAVGDRTEIRMHCHYDKAPAHEPGSERYTFRLFSVSKAGIAQEVSTWSASFGDDMTFMTTADVRTSDIGRVELRKDDGASVILAYDVA